VKFNISYQKPIIWQEALSIAAAKEQSRIVTAGHLRLAATKIHLTVPG
jgi:hypothetical protein